MSTVLITGSSRGLGLALADVFAQAGCDLILHSKERVLPTYDNVDCFNCKGDLRSEYTILELNRLALDNDIDLLINNAAEYMTGNLIDFSEEEIRENIEINLLAPIALIKAIWPIFKQKHRGMIININSLAGVQGGKEETIYCAGKFGLRGFTEALQFDATRDGINVVNVFIGCMKTELSKHKLGWQNYILPEDAAQVIFSLYENQYSSVRITELVLNRRKY